MTYNKKSRSTTLLIKGISRRRAENFKRDYKAYLKANGLNLEKFYKFIITKAMSNPVKALKSN